MDASCASTVKLSNVDYLNIDRQKLGKAVKKCDPSQYFYLAGYSNDTFISNEALREALLRINQKQIKDSKKTFSLLPASLGGSTKKHPYFMFPSEFMVA